MSACVCVIQNANFCVYMYIWYVTKRYINKNKKRREMGYNEGYEGIVFGGIIDACNSY